MDGTFDRWPLRRKMTDWVCGMKVFIKKKKLTIDTKLILLFFSGIPRLSVENKPYR